MTTRTRPRLGGYWLVDLDCWQEILSDPERPPGLFVLMFSEDGILCRATIAQDEETEGRAVISVEFLSYEMDATRIRIRPLPVEDEEGDASPDGGDGGGGDDDTPPPWEFVRWEETEDPKIPLVFHDARGRAYPVFSPKVDFIATALGIPPGVLEDLEGAFADQNVAFSPKPRLYL